METIKEIAQRVINEELKYMKSLLLLEHVYFPVMPTLEKEPDVKALFSAFQSVKSLTEDMLVQMLGTRRPKDDGGLVLNEDESAQVMNALLDAANLVETYQDYYTQYKKCLPLLTKLLSSDKYRDAQNDAIQLPQSEGTSIENIMSYPLTRVINYRNELHFLVNLPSADTISLPNFRNLLTSLNPLSTRCAEESDEQKKRFELNAVWDTILTSTDISAIDSASVLKQGDLERFGRHGFRPIRLVLLSNAVMNGKIVNGKIELRRSTDLRWVTLTNFSDSYLQFSFSLSTPSKTFILKASSQAEKHSWMRSLQEAIDSLSNEEVFCSSNSCVSINRALSREEQSVCRFCGKTFCKKCIGAWDLVQNCLQRDTLASLDPSQPPLKFFCPICPACREKAEMAAAGGEAPEDEASEKVAEVDMEVIPPGWVEMGGEEEKKYYYHSATHHAMYLHPNAAFYLEKEFRDEVVPFNWRRTYTEEGEKYYQNLETGEVTWTLPTEAKS